MRSIDHGPWLWCSKASLERSRKAGGMQGVAIYIALCHLESDAPEKYKGAFFASRKNISEVSGLPVRTITRYLPVLQKAGLFRMESGKSNEAGLPHQANRFSLLDIGQSGQSSSQDGHSPMATKSSVNGQHKRTFFHGVKKKVRDQSEKESGAAGASLAVAKSADAPRQKPKWLSGF